ncbi:MAG: uncharacterized protein JWO22_3219 [Frankiales bacterium]|nr:uncharacterized protein [Frankiales bacterium]
MLGALTPLGLAGTDVHELSAAILSAWDDFLSVVDSADLSKPSRLKGLSCRDVLVHLGTWDDHLVLPGLVAAAEGDTAEAAGSPDDINCALLARHTDATHDDVRAALVRSRADIAAFLGSDEAARIGTRVVTASVGRLPLLTVLSAGRYELAVHALDLRADEPSAALLGNGLAALIDVTGALAQQHGIAMTLTALAPEGGWSFTSTAEGWTTSRASGSFSGPGVRAAAAVLLDASAGRAFLPALLARRRLKVQDMTGFLQLAPMIDAVPGLPGGPVLRKGVKALARLF